MYSSSEITGAEIQTRAEYDQYRAANPPAETAPDFGKTPKSLAEVQRDMIGSFRGIPESAFDGNASLLLKHQGNNKPEFSPGTDVYVVNGIRTDFLEAATAANIYAKTIGEDVHLIHASTKDHNVGLDLATSLLEKTSQSAAFELPPEKSIAEAVLSHISDLSDPAHGQFKGNVHFAAHSRGALVTERGLELAEKTLEAHGWKADQIEKAVFSHVTVETFGGASTGFPKGVKAVHYIDPHDLVAQAFGMETPNAHGLRALEELTMLGPEGAALSGILGTQMMQKQVLHVGSHAPGIETSSGRSLNPLTDLLNAHDFNNYLGQRKNFAVELDRFEHREQTWESVHPAPSPEHAPVPELQAFDGENHVVDATFSRTGQMHDLGKFVAQSTDLDGHKATVLYDKQSLLEHTPPQERAALTEAIAKHKSVTIGGNSDGMLSVTAHESQTQQMPAPARTRTLNQGIGGRAD